MKNKNKVAAFVVAVLAGFLTQGASGQGPAGLRINVGDASVNGVRVQPYTNQWRMTRTLPNGQVLEDAGTWNDELTVVTMEGKDCLQRTQTAAFRGSDGETKATTRNVNVFDRKTFAPLLRIYEKHVAGGEDSKLTIRFGTKSMRIETVENRKMETREAPTGAAFDFYGGVYAVLWAALPLKQGFSASYPSYAEGDHPETISWVTMRVTGAEDVEAGPNKRVRAWVVESDTDIGKLKYWVSDAPPYIIRMDFKQPDGTAWLLKMS
ncbi:MAG TPA: hypothetical protein VMH00_16380 [Candidatus Limnocylindrales bacterium]|nr:hypothetical protein [Candidatus Limnocylindrales bacterium]